MQRQVFATIKIFVLACALFLGVMPTTSAANQGFGDVPADHWAYDAVMYVDSMNLVHHYDGNTFRGSENATRYDLAYMMGRMAQMAQVQADKNFKGFSDVPKKHWCAQYVNLATNNTEKFEFMSGYGDGTFRGDEEVNRFDVALAFAAFAQIKAAGNEQIFTDIPADHWAYDAVNALGERGIMEGYGDGSFRGENKITRYEVAMICVKVIAQ